MPKAVKAKISKQKTKEIEAVEEQSISEYMKQVIKRRKHNSERIKSINKEMNTWTTRLKIIARKSKPKNSINEPKYKYDHSLIRSYKEESDKRYCCENGDLFGVVCLVCLIKFERTNFRDTLCQV